MRLAPGTLVVGKWPRGGVRFEVQRGTFTIPYALRDDDPDAFARRFAQALDGRHGATVTSRREGELEVFTWRVTRLVAA